MTIGQLIITFVLSSLAIYFIVVKKRIPELDVVQAKEIEVINSTTVEFINGIDNKKRYFYLDGNEVRYGADTTSKQNSVPVFTPSRSQSDSTDSRPRRSRVRHHH